jgi:hypothetical protein
MSFIPAAWVAVTLASASAIPQTQIWKKNSIFRVEHQFEVPGALLAPGTYVIRLEEANGSRHTVTLLNHDETRVVATLQAVPDHRIRPEGDAVLSFHPAPPGEPQPVQSWYYSGDLAGLELVYPIERAREIATRHRTPVMAATDEGGIAVVTRTGVLVLLEKPPADVKD